MPLFRSCRHHRERASCLLRAPVVVGRCDRREFGGDDLADLDQHRGIVRIAWAQLVAHRIVRSEEHTSELQSLMRISYAVFCLKKKKNPTEQEINGNNYIKKK